MKRILILTLILGLALPVGLASAATVVVQNYFYAHENTPGSFYFKDKYGSQSQYGDNVQHDAVITAIRVSAQGMQSGDQIVLTTSGGASYEVAPGEQLSLNVPKNQYIQIKLIKSGFNEVFAKLDYMNTFDDSDGGTNVSYTFSVNEIPTSYGDLGPGNSGGNATIIEGNYYYFEPQDSYKYDYPPPPGVSYYELHFDGAAGHFYRTYNHAPTGIHYLTCNGSYVMRFFDGSGQLVAMSQTMTTTQIQSPTCNSQPGTGAGYQDFNVYRTIDQDMPQYDLLLWDEYPGAYHYRIYMNGQLIDEQSGTTLRIQRDNAAYSVVALDAYKQYLAQADLAGTSGGDPGGGGGNPGGGDPGDCTGCDMLREILECPEWQLYLGGLTQAIKDAWPNPPYWQGVADIFRDKIVPEMGAEIVRRAPAVAKIIADEFESREDPVYPPGTLAAYNPPYAIPTPTDMPTQIPFDLNSGIPDFEPDYSGSQPFTIPDPTNIQLDDTDAGYDPPDPTPSNNPVPVYQGSEPIIEPDPGYSGSVQDDVSAPGYVITNPDATTPIKNYQISETDDGNMPGYQGAPSDPEGIPSYQMPTDTMPGYQGPTGGNNEGE